MWLQVSSSNCIFVGLGVHVFVCPDCQGIWFVSLRVCSVKMWGNRDMYECVHVCMCVACMGACMVVCVFIL